MPEEAAEGSSSAAGAAEGALPSVASTLRAPAGMAFSVEHNPGDGSHTLHIVPESQAAHLWPTASAQQWALAPAELLPGRNDHKSVHPNPLVERLLIQHLWELIRWICSFVIIGTGLAVVVKRPSQNLSSFITFNLFLASFHSVGAFSGKLRPRTPTIAKAATGYICYVVVDSILSIVGMLLMWKVKFSVEGGASLVAAVASTISAATFVGTVGNIIGLSTGDYSPEDLEEAYHYTPGSNRPKTTDGVELDTFSRSRGGERHTNDDNDDEEQEEEEASDDEDTTSKPEKEETRMLLHKYLEFTSGLHYLQCILCLPIFAISAAVAAQNRDELHYTAAFNTFITGTMCTYLPFFSVSTASPSTARIDKYYLAFLASSLVITFIANVLMWHIYATEQYLPAAFAGWAGTTIAFCSAYELRWLIVLEDKDYTAKQMRVAYSNSYLHCAYLAETGLRSGLIEHPDTWIIQSVFSVFALFFTSYEVASRPERSVVGAMAFNLALTTARLLAIRCDVWILAPKEGKRPSLLYGSATTGNLLLAIIGMISALSVRGNELSYSLLMTRMADIAVVIFAAVDVGMTIREYKNPREKHDYQAIDNANEGLLSETFAVGSDDEEEGLESHDEVERPQKRRVEEA